MPILFKKFTLILLSFLVLFFSTAPYFQVKAIDFDPDNLWSHTWYAETWFPTWYQKVYDVNTSPSSEIFGERYTAAQVQWVTYGVLSQFLNLIPGNPDLLICLLNAGGNGPVNCLTLITKIVTSLKLVHTVPSNDTFAVAVESVSDGPVSGVGYVKNLASKFTLVGPVKAQGFGYSSVGSTVQNLWTITRNISFSLIVLVTIVLAFMIMFRVKISPQVVISVQSAIPKLIMTMILITFSYAIAGFVIDLMYVFIGLIATLLASSGLTGFTNPVDMFKELTTGNGVFSLIYIYWIDLLVMTIGAFSVSNFIPWLLLLIGAICLIVMVIYWSIKIMFIFFKTLALILLTIVLGPLEILTGAFVSSSGFMPWFKKLVAHVAVFPVMGIMFFFSFFFLVQGGNIATGSAIFPFKPTVNVIQNSAWEPPLSTFNGMGGPGGDAGSKITWIIVSILIFSNITKVAEIVESAIYGSKFNFGSELAAGASTSLSIVGGAMQNYGENSRNQSALSMPAEVGGGILQAIGRSIH